MTHHHNTLRDGDDDDKNKKARQPTNPGPEAGDYSLGDESDDFGTQIGEGHNPIEDR
jgi:hypothetical protein